MLASPTRRVLAVLDGQNLAWSASRIVAGDAPLYFPAAIACLADSVASLQRAGAEAVAFIPAHWLRAAPLPGGEAAMLGAGGPSLGELEAATLRRLIACGAAIEVPSRDKDDPYMLSFAHARAAFLLQRAAA